jgi:hypothetical protein
MTIYTKLFTPSKNPLRQTTFQDLISQARLLFTSPGNQEFKTKYQEALQREPAVVMAHSAVMQLLRQDS